MELRKPSTPSELFAIYLNDHRAAANAGRGLAARCAASNDGTTLGEYLRTFLAELDQDVTLLEGVCGESGVPDARIKRWVARAGHHLGSLKLNGQLLGYSPLSRVIELESLIAAVNAKRQLWQTLLDGEITRRTGDVPRGDIEAAVRRAEQQVDRLAEHHGDAVRQAFGESALSPTSGAGTAVTS